MKNEKFGNELRIYADEVIDTLKEDGKSKNTLDSYGRTYDHFIDKFLVDYDKVLTFNNIKHRDLRNFLKYKELHMEKQGELAVSSKAAYVTHLKKLFTYIEKNADELYDFSKIFEGFNFKIPVRTPKSIPEDDEKRLEKYFKTYKTLKRTYVLTRNILLVKLMYYSGLRVSEANTIRYTDLIYIKEDNIYDIDFIGKGDKERYSFIKKELIEDELRYLKLLDNYNDKNLIALTTRNKKMDRFQIYSAVNKIYRDAGISGLSGNHILRHQCAKNLLVKDETPVNVVSEVLGHGSIQTTSIYLKPSKAMARKQIAKRSS